MASNKITGGGGGGGGALTSLGRPTLALSSAVSLFSLQATQIGIKVESAVRIKNHSARMCNQYFILHNTVIIL